MAPTLVATPQEGLHGKEPSRSHDRCDPPEQLTDSAAAQRVGDPRAEHEVVLPGRQHLEEVAGEQLDAGSFYATLGAQDVDHRWPVLEHGLQASPGELEGVLAVAASKVQDGVGRRSHRRPPL